MDRIKIALLALLVTGGMACHSTSKLSEQDEGEGKQGKARGHEGMGAGMPEILKFRGADLNIEWNGSSSKIHINLGIIRDSVVVASVIPAAGIEVVRIYCTNDSLILINRREKTFDKMSVGEASRQLGFGFTLKDIQAILTGSPFIYSRIEAGDFRKREQSGKEGKKMEHYSLASGGKYQISQNMIYNGKGGSLRRIEMTDPKSRASLSADYEDYTLKGGVFVPGVISIVLRDPGNSIRIEISRARILVNQEIRLGPMIPEGYQPSHFVFTGHGR